MQQTLYPMLLSIHNYLRWLVILAALWALVRAYLGWLGEKAWAAADRRAGMVYTISLDVQFLIGLLLSIFSPLVVSAVRDVGAAMSSAPLRFVLVEHIPAMLIALILGHIGSVRARNAPVDQAKHKQAAVWFTLSAIAVMVAIPWWRPLLRGLF